MRQLNRMVADIHGNSGKVAHFLILLAVTVEMCESSRPGFKPVGYWGLMRATDD
jgi:hypothetical protein